MSSKDILNNSVDLSSTDSGSVKSETKTKLAYYPNMETEISTVYNGIISDKDLVINYNNLDLQSDLIKYLITNKFISNDLILSKDLIKQIVNSKAYIKQQAFNDTISKISLFNNLTYNQGGNYKDALRVMVSSLIYSTDLEQIDIRNCTDTLSVTSTYGAFASKYFPMFSGTDGKPGSAQISVTGGQQLMTLNYDTGYYDILGYSDFISSTHKTKFCFTAKPDDGSGVFNVTPWRLYGDGGSLPLEREFPNLLLTGKFELGSSIYRTLLDTSKLQPVQNGISSSSKFFKAGTTMINNGGLSDAGVMDIPYTMDSYSWTHNVTFNKNTDITNSDGSRSINYVATNINTSTITKQGNTTFLAPTRAKMFSLKFGDNLEDYYYFNWRLNSDSRSNMLVTDSQIENIMNVRNKSSQYTYSNTTNTPQQWSMDKVINFKNMNTVIGYSDIKDGSNLKKTIDQYLQDKLDPNGYIIASKVDALCNKDFYYFLPSSRSVINIDDNPKDTYDQCQIVHVAKVPNGYNTITLWLININNEVYWFIPLNYLPSKQESISVADYDGQGLLVSISSQMFQALKYQYKCNSLGDLVPNNTIKRIDPIGRWISGKPNDQLRILTDENHNYCYSELKDGGSTVITSLPNDKTRWWEAISTNLSYSPTIAYSKIVSNLPNDGLIIGSSNDSSPTMLFGVNDYIDYSSKDDDEQTIITSAQVIDDETDQQLLSVFATSSIGISDVPTDVVNKLTTDITDITPDSDDYVNYLLFKQTFINNFVDHNNSVGLIGLLRIIKANNESTDQILSYISKDNYLNKDQYVKFANRWLAEISAMSNVNLDSLVDSLDYGNEFSVINSVLSPVLNDDFEETLKYIKDNFNDSKNYQNILNKINDSVSSITSGVTSSINQYINNNIPKQTQELLDNDYGRSYDNNLINRTNTKFLNVAASLIETACDDPYLALKTFSNYLSNRTKVVANNKLMNSAILSTKKLTDMVDGMSKFVVDGLKNMGPIVANIATSAVSTVSKTVSFVDNAYNLFNMEYLLMSKIKFPLSNTPSIIGLDDSKTVSNADYILKDSVLSNMYLISDSFDPIINYFVSGIPLESIDLKNSFVKIIKSHKTMIFDNNAKYPVMYTDYKSNGKFNEDGKVVWRLLPNLHKVSLKKYQLPGEVCGLFINQLELSNYGDTLSPYKPFTTGDYFIYSGLIAAGSIAAAGAAMLTTPGGFFGIGKLLAGATAAASVAAVNGVALAAIVSRANANTSVFEYKPKVHANVYNLVNNLKPQDSKMSILFIEDDDIIVDAVQAPSYLKKTSFIIKNSLGIIGGLAFIGLSAYVGTRMVRGLQNAKLKRAVAKDIRQNSQFDVNRPQSKKIASQQLGLNSAKEAVITQAGASGLTKILGFTTGVVTGSIGTVITNLKKLASKLPTNDTSTGSSTTDTIANVIASLTDLSKIIEATNDNTIITNKLLR